MNTCTRNTSACDGLDVQLVKLYLRRELRPLCRGCRSVLTRLGMDFTVVESDRRPAWMSRSLVRDETGRLVA